MDLTWFTPQAGDDMRLSEMLENDHVEIATLDNHYDWVKTRAREIDTEKEMHLAIKLDRIMRHFRKSYKFAGASSNNIYWKLTDVPVRAMLIPITRGKYRTIINPRYLELKGKEANHVEACGSLPGNKTYVVRRKSYVLISGYTLDNKYTELAYGSADGEADEDPVLLSYHRREWVIQHEMDHLNGVTIKDIGRLFDLDRLVG